MDIVWYVSLWRWVTGYTNTRCPSGRQRRIVLFSQLRIVACWPLTMRAALSLFSVKITSMFLCGKMRSDSTAEAQGMVLRGRPGKR